MKQYLLTHSSFTGEVRIFYNADLLLDGFDCTTTDLTERRRDMLRQIIPVRDSGFEQVKELIKGCHIIEEDVAITFEMFWIKYDKKINRKRCEPLWEKLSKSEKFAAYNGIYAYNRYLEITGYRNKLDPERYLKYKSWQNEWK